MQISVISGGTVSQYTNISFSARLPAFATPAPSFSTRIVLQRSRLSIVRRSLRVHGFHRLTFWWSWETVVVSRHALFAEQIAFMKHYNSFEIRWKRSKHLLREDRARRSAGSSQTAVDAGWDLDEEEPKDGTYKIFWSYVSSQTLKNVIKVGIESERGPVRKVS